MECGSRLGDSIRMAGVEAQINGQSREVEARKLGDAAVEMCIVIL